MKRYVYQYSIDAWSKPIKEVITSKRPEERRKKEILEEAKGNHWLEIYLIVAENGKQRKYCEFKTEL